MAQKYLALKMISISIKNLEVLINRLYADLKQSAKPEPAVGYTSEQLKEYFIEYQIYPPETFYDEDLFSASEPLVTVTYMWPATPIRKLAELLKRRFDENSLVYIDIFLNDQRSFVSIAVSLRNATVRCVENNGTPKS